MAEPTPAAGPSPPPLNKFPFTVPGTGLCTLMAISFLTQLWAAVLGAGGISPSLEALIEEVALLTNQVGALAVRVGVIFGMHGDGTLSATGELTVTSTNGNAFGPFATGTNAADLTGTLAAARIADDSLPYAKLVNTVGAELLGADSAGPVGAIGVGRGLHLAAATLTANDGPAVAVSALGTPTACFRAFVNDSSVVAAGNFGAVVAGGGGNFVPVYADGVNWRIG